MPYVTFGYCYQRGKKSEFHNKYEELMEAYKAKTIHGTRSLDEFYYSSLPEMDERNQNQVVTRSFFGTPNGKGVPQGHQQWPYLAVDQLWLWVIDEETIITSSTHRQDGFDDPVIEIIFRQLREAKIRKIGQPPPSSVQEMSRFLVLFCVDFINSLKWEDLSKFEKGDFVSKSVQLLYEDRINDVAAKEKLLAHSFMVKMKGKKNNSEKKTQAKPKLKTQNGRTKLEEVGKTKNIESYEEDNSNNWASISSAADLLDEVKDILDELMILKTLVSQQGSVWQDLVGNDPKRDNARGPAYTLRTIEEMIKMADRVQVSVKDILDLEQNAINIDQAIESTRQGTESARQGTILMSFTIVTVLFTPLSFLTSLFALNVTVFQHNSAGIIEYKPGWIFPILFGVSTGVIGSVVIYAFRDSLPGFQGMREELSKGWKKYKEERFWSLATDPEKGQPDANKN
ncbi:hypothetical protein F5Y12DRAFT_278246 [Xylaria sp. FL1777]|nr:hypothetical protein F5Y12DRAFT_278246 [Xylaria sp. FL1777]